jgi:two-component system, NtrC family, sensor kinase
MFNAHLFPPGFFLYFVYGLTFIFLGVAIAVKDMSESRLKLAGSLPYLAGFGFSHGFNEWCEAYLLLAQGGVHVELLPLHYLRLLALIVSFLFLNQFAISLLRFQPRIRWLLYRLALPLFLLFLLGYYWFAKENLDLEFFGNIKTFSRLTIGTFGAGLTAYALFFHARDIEVLNRSVAWNLRGAGIIFGLYAGLTGLVPSHSEIPVAGIPVEVLRITAAIAITLFMVRALNVFDIETRRELEMHLRQQGHSEKLAALGKLAAGVAHEINNPLTVASLNIQTLRARMEQTEVEPIIMRKLLAAEKNIDRASVIAKDLLNFSRQTPLAPEQSKFSSLRLDDILAGSLNCLAHRLRGVAVRRESKPTPPLSGEADKLQQVFINILENAIDAMPEGGEIRIRSFGKGPWVVVELSDTGSGIPEELISRVFEPFFTTKDPGKGIGLGLAICHSIINQHQGSIGLKSTVGQGTTISVKLPVESK